MVAIQDADVSVKIPEELRNGLRYSAVTHKPKTTMRDLLVVILENAGIDRMTEKELDQKLRGVKHWERLLFYRS